MLVETEDESIVIPSMAPIGNAFFAYASVQMLLREVAEAAVAKVRAAAGDRE